jgi:hypothetical protein
MVAAPVARMSEARSGGRRVQRPPRIPLRSMRATRLAFPSRAARVCANLRQPRKSHVADVQRTAEMRLPSSARGLLGALTYGV